MRISIVFRFLVDSFINRWLSLIVHEGSSLDICLVFRWLVETNQAEIRCKTTCKYGLAINVKFKKMAPFEIKKVHAAIPKGNMGYDQYTVSDTVTVEPTFAASL